MQIIHGPPDIGILRALVAAGEKQNDGLAHPGMIDAVTRTPMDPKLRHTFPARFAVTEVAGLKTLDTRQDACLGLPVAKGIQPIREGFAAIRCLVPDQVEHEA